MEIKYKLLENGKGVLTERTQGIAAGAITLYFEGIEDGASAVFVTGKGTFCREIHGSRCVINASALHGVVEVGVVTSEANETPRRWVCEGLRAKYYPQGVFICPDGADLAANVAAVMIENEEIKKASIRGNIIKGDRGKRTLKVYNCGKATARDIRVEGLDTDSLAVMRNYLFPYELMNPQDYTEVIIWIVKDSPSTIKLKYIWDDDFGQNNEFEQVLTL